MFKLNIDKFGEVEVRFEHYRGDREKYNRITKCSLISGDEIISTGYSWCSKQDNFEKEIGRKIAMARALVYFSVNKAGFVVLEETTPELRRKFWNDYWLASNKPERIMGEEK